MNTKILRSEHRRPAPQRSKLEERLADEARFIRSWFDSPLKTGAVSPSGRFLARAMARCVDPHDDGLIVELGPGTGPVTEALIERGVAPERLVLVEYDAAFCKLLERRFPHSRIVQGDAYRLSDTLADVIDAPVAAIVSSLPLLTRPERTRLALLDEAFALMGPEGQFVQFTYGLVSPMPLGLNRRTFTLYRSETAQPVWLNLPPARVWRYTRADAQAAPRAPLKKKTTPIAPAKELLRKIVDGARDARR